MIGAAAHVVHKKPMRRLPERFFIHHPSHMHENLINYCIAAFAIFCFKRRVGRTLGKNLEKHMYLLLKGRCSQVSLWYEIKNEVPEMLSKKMVWLEICKTLAIYKDIFSLLRHSPSLGWCS